LFAVENQGDHLVGDELGVGEAVASEEVVLALVAEVDTGGTKKMLSTGSGRSATSI
jgi:hypothetical protein